VRHVIVYVLAAMSILLYLDRNCVGFAATYIREDLGLDQSDIGWFISAFFWSYALAQVPSGWLSDRYGARLMLALYIASWSLFTAFIGAVHSLALLLGMRLLCGLGQAGAYPTASAVIGNWIPVAGRGMASGIISLGGRIGGAIAPLLTAWLIVLCVPSDVPLAFRPQEVLRPGEWAAAMAPLAPEDETWTKAVAGRKPLAPPSARGAQIWDLHDVDERRTVASIAAPHRTSLRIRVEETESGSSRAATKQEEEEARKVADSQRTQLAPIANRLLDDPRLAATGALAEVNLPAEATKVRRDLEADRAVSAESARRFRRLLLEAAFPSSLGKLYVHGWRPVMGIFGLPGLVVAAAYWFAFRDRPGQHPWCNAAERELIAAGLPPGSESVAKERARIPWGPLLKSPGMWLVCVMQWGTNVGWLFLVAYLPRYLEKVHNVPILDRGFFSTVPLAVGIVGMFLGGVVTDRMRHRFGLKWGRLMPMLLTRFLAAAAYVACLLMSLPVEGGGMWGGVWAFTVAFSVVAFATDMGNPAVWAYCQDVGGRNIGSIHGWGNMWGNLGAAVSPKLYDLVLGENPTPREWNLMFGMCLGAFVLAGVCCFWIDATVPIVPPEKGAPQAT
jgi:MFS family permease